MKGKQQAAVYRKWPKEMEVATAKARLAAGAIKLECYGSENTYYFDEHGNRFFCKDYPNPIEKGQTHG
jgi:hypothetical protein